MRRIGMLTSGGDCQALNATMRGVAKSLYNMYDDVEIIGFEDGYKGLIYANYKIMQPSDFSGILTEGGTILGTSRQPFNCKSSKIFFRSFFIAHIFILHIFKTAINSPFCHLNDGLCLKMI